ncbi:MAG: MMPL family transporter [Chloroflexi bacterium]|nr:MMPL family transporter [Chloroflexota bacterium]
MPFRLSTESLARQSARRPWTTVALWAIAFVAALFLIATLLGDALTSQIDFTNRPESKRGDLLLDDRLRDERQAREIVIVRSTELSVDDPAFRAFVTGLFEEITSLGPEIVEPGSAANFYLTGDASLVSPDRRTTIIPFLMAGDLDDAVDNVDRVHDTVAAAMETDGFEVFSTGIASVSRETFEILGEDLVRGETIGIVIALIILIAVFGTIAAALLPLLLAAVAIVMALGLAAVVGQFIELSFFITTMIVMIGLAVGIDYSLFIVERYREERRGGLEKIEAIARAGATGSRTVLFSGVTVVLALIGMVIVPTTIFQSLGLGSIMVVIMAVAASLTLLPAVLSIVGDRVNKLRVPFFGKQQTAAAESDAGGFWYWVARTVMRRPLLSMTLSVGLLIAAAVPYFDINPGFAGIDTLPEGLQSKTGFQILDRDFSAGRITPADVVIDGDIDSPEVRAGIDRLTRSLAQDDAFAPPLPLEVNPARDLALLPVPINADSNSDAAIDAVKRLRRQHVAEAFDGVPGQVLVTGETAFAIDFFRLISDITPVVFGFVLGLTFLLLTLVFRSIVVPIKAMILNLLSVGAAYGMLVLVFQKGVATGFFGFQQVDTIEAWIPLFLFSVLFGLSMDYHVFMLSRIRERFDRTGDNADSVAFGLRSTGKIITGAAFIMVAVFGGFASGRLVSFEQMGFGLGVAILLDATIIRMVLVPSTMRLLGNVNWYFPTWLRWLPDVRVQPAAARPTEASGE